MFPPAVPTNTPARHTGQFWARGEDPVLGCVYFRKSRSTPFFVLKKTHCLVFSTRVLADLGLRVYRNAEQPGPAPGLAPSTLPWARGRIELTSSDARPAQTLDSGTLMFAVLSRSFPSPRMRCGHRSHLVSQRAGAIAGGLLEAGGGRRKLTLPNTSVDRPVHRVIRPLHRVGHGALLCA